MAVNNEHNREDQTANPSMRIEGETENPMTEDHPPAHAHPWASALRDLYHQVVEEPLPPSLADLLARLDDAGE